VSYSDEVLADSPLVYARLGESSGATTAIDSSGNGRNGTYGSSPTLGVTGLLTGDADTAMTLAANSGQCVTWTSASWMNPTAAWTAEAWVKFAGAVEANDTIASRYDGGSGDQWLLYRHDTGKIAVQARNASSSYVTVTDPTVATAGTTYHVVGTWDGSTLRLYVNGTQVASAAMSALNASTTAMQIGRQGGYNSTTPAATVDEFAFYNTALSADRIAAHYATGTGAGPTVPEVTADFSGTGTLSATAFEVGVVAAAFSGSGSLSADTSATHAIVAAFSGSGTLSAVTEGVGGGVVPEVTADFTGSGTLTASVEGDSAGPDTDNRDGGLSLGGYASATWEPPVVEPPAAIVHGEAVDVAQAFGPVTMDGTQPVYDVATAEVTRHRNRIVVGGVDITYFRDVETPLPSYQLVSPLLYGPATLRLPQVSAAFEQAGTGALSWLKPEKTVKVQRVDAETGDVVATDYKGVIIAINGDGADLTVEIGGEASGRAALMEKPLPIFRAYQDIGQLAFWAVRRELELPFKPRGGPDTVIRIGRFGGTGMLDYLSQLCARAWTRSGNQWTIMPDGGVYRMQRKDTTTIAATAYLDDARVVASLRRDLAEEPNRVFVTGVTPSGRRVLFAAWPGLKQGPAAPYPFDDDRSFGTGTTDADTDTGDGIAVLLARLQVTNYLDTDDAPGGFDADVATAIRDLQRDTELPVTGNMTAATWRALFDLDATGYSLRGAQILPADQKSYTKKWIRSGSGAVIRRNENYDHKRLKRDRTIDVGAGLTVPQMREAAKTEIEESTDDNALGTIAFHTGALVSGDHSWGDPISVYRARRLKPGMNLKVSHSTFGPLTVHVSAVSVGEDGKVTATVDTRARDSMAAWEVIQRNRESRRDPARQWVRQHRASGEIKDAVDGWYNVGGLLYDNVVVPGNRWTVFPVVAGQEGTVARLLLNTAPNAEFVVAVFGRGVAGRLPQRLTRLVGNPLTEAGTKKWEDEGVRNTLDRSNYLLYAAGSNEQPCGYWPKTKATGEEDPNPLTGKWKDDAGFSYYTFAQPVLYVAVYADRDTVIPAGRIMWPQLEAGA
jgi:hypothetical protein